MLLQQARIKQNTWSTTLWSLQVTLELRILQDIRSPSPLSLQLNPWYPLSGRNHHRTSEAVRFIGTTLMGKQNCCSRFYMYQMDKVQERSRHLLQPLASMWQNILQVILLPLLLLQELPNKTIRKNLYWRLQWPCCIHVFLK